MVSDAYMKEDGTPLHGFTFAVWASIVTNAAGGMIVATVMKFAGNILRNFAQACAIIVGGFGSWLLFDFVITTRFVGGVALVSRAPLVGMGAAGQTWAIAQKHICSPARPRRKSTSRYLCPPLESL